MGRGTHQERSGSRRGRPTPPPPRCSAAIPLASAAAPRPLLARRTLHRPSCPPNRLNCPLARPPNRSIKNDEAAKAGRLTFRGQAHSHATGPDEHAYGLDLELHGEIDDTDIKQVRKAAARRRCSAQGQGTAAVVGSRVGRALLQGAAAAATLHWHAMNECSQPPPCPAPPAADH